MAITKTTKLDAQGRVLLPPYIRNELGLNPGQKMNVRLENGTIKINPAEERCCLCGEAADNNSTAVTIGPKDQRICLRCAEIIVRAAGK